MRRRGRKHGVRSTRCIRYCCYCRNSHVGAINTAIEKDLASKNEEHKEEEEPINERKRLIKGMAVPEDNSTNYSGVIKKRAQCEAVWKTINKQYIMKICRDKGATIIGDPCHRCVITDRDRHHAVDYMCWGIKGKFKQSLFLSKLYKDCDVCEATENFEHVSSLEPCY